MKFKTATPLLGATLFLAGMVAAAFTVLPGMAAINASLTCATAECADLAAQRSMALASWAMVTVTVITTVVGAATLVLIYYTLEAARRSAKAAEDTFEQARQSTELAEATLATAQQAYQVQTRAYLTVAAATLMRADDELLVTLQIKNSGTTPAAIVGANIATKLFRPSTSDPHSGEIAADLGLAKKYLPDIAASDTETTTIRLAVQDVIDPYILLLLYGELHVAITGYLTYRDIAGQQHHYDFGFDDDVRGPKPMQRRPIAETETKAVF